MTMGPRTRFRSVENVLAEVEECVKKYNFEHFSIADDTFTLNQERAIEICYGLKKLGVRSWHCGGTRVNAVSPKMLKVMAETGCQKVAFGVESGSPRILELIGKKITLEQVKNAFLWAREAGIRFIEGNFIIGSDPAETQEDLKMTLDLIREIKPDLVSLAIIVPYPGTRVYEKMKSRGYIFTEDWEKFAMIDQVPCWRTEHFTSEELLKYQKKMLRNFYLRPDYLWRILVKLKNLDEIKYWAGTGWGFVRWLVKEKLT